MDIIYYYWISFRSSEAHLGTFSAASYKSELRRIFSSGKPITRRRPKHCSIFSSSITQTYSAPLSLNTSSGSTGYPRKLPPEFSDEDTTAISILFCFIAK